MPIHCLVLYFIQCHAHVLSRPLFHSISCPCIVSSSISFNVMPMYYLDLYVILWCAHVFSRILYYYISCPCFVKASTSFYFILMYCLDLYFIKVHFRVMPRPLFNWKMSWFPCNSNEPILFYLMPMYYI